MIKLKIEKIGDSLETAWPQGALDHLRAKEGDTLRVVETRAGFLVVKSGDPVEEAVAAMEEAIDLYQNAYRELAKK